MIQQVSDFELELMKTIWETAEPPFTRKLPRRWKRRARPQQKIRIIFLLSRLIEKDFLKTNKIGRRNRYTALVSEADYRAAQTETFLDKIYEGSAKDLISTLIQKEMISPDDYENLKKHWEGSCLKR